MKRPIKPLAELLDSVRNIEGFPIGKDEDILALSNPPYYTACPNPYVNDFIDEYGKKYDEETDEYSREPYVGDVSEGKNDPIYLAHSYHTKVPYKAIMEYIQHYTAKDDIIFDGFCGTGMAGIAAQMLGRKAILSDLSPIATFIAYNFNLSKNSADFLRTSLKALDEVENECCWMYETNHTSVPKKEQTTQLTTLPKENSLKGKINYTVWSDVLFCPFCGKEFSFYEVAVDKETWQVSDTFKCIHCRAAVDKKDCKRKEIVFYDNVLGKNVHQIFQTPVLIHYYFNKKKYLKQPDADDFALIEKIAALNIPNWFPADDIHEGDKTNEPLKIGITNVHHYYTKRNLWVLSSFASKLKSKTDFVNVTSVATVITKLYRFRSQNGSLGAGGGPQNGTLYIPSLFKEIPMHKAIKEHIAKWSKVYNITRDFKNAYIGVSSISDLSNISDNTIDYIFTDPPFGDNIMYSELSYIWESWLKVFTNNTKEAIINKTQNKRLADYSTIMTKAFQEYHRVLKPNRWITVEFHNTKSAVWNTIQDSISKAGFVIANVATIDKKQGSFNQVNVSGSVKNDLVISAYKPKSSFTRQFLEMAGEGLEEEFIRMHLSHLKPEPSIERTEQMLYSKMLAYYVQRSYTVKYDASTFYKMLRNKFVEKDGYWFNSDQLPGYQEYKRKMKLEGIDEISKGMLSLFVSDEKSALIWLHAFLDTPKDFQTIHPAFHKVASITGDKVPDLRAILEDNFIREDDTYRRPQSEDEKLTINQKRERELMREFEAILLEAKSSKKKIKEVRKQSLVYGFEQCYKAKRFGDILAVSKRLDSSILENNADITEFIEVAEMKTEGF